MTHTLPEAVPIHVMIIMSPLFVTEIVGRAVLTASMGADHMIPSDCRVITLLECRECVDVNL